MMNGRSAERVVTTPTLPDAACWTHTITVFILYAAMPGCIDHGFLI